MQFSLFFIFRFLGFWIFLCQIFNWIFFKKGCFTRTVFFQKVVFYTMLHNIHNVSFDVSFYSIFAFFSVWNFAIFLAKPEIVKINLLQVLQNRLLITIIYYKVFHLLINFAAICMKPSFWWQTYFFYFFILNNYIFINIIFCFRNSDLLIVSKQTYFRVNPVVLLSRGDNFWLQASLACLFGCCSKIKDRWARRKFYINLQKQKMEKYKIKKKPILHFLFKTLYKKRQFWKTKNF